MQSKPAITMIPYGGPGVGKSCLLNTLCGMPGHFKSSSSAATGVTKKIGCVECMALGNHPSIRLKLFDAPGVGDFELTLDQIILDIKLSIGHDQGIDCALVVIQSTDYRITVQETIAIKAITKFFSNFSPKNVFLVITHCDQLNPSDSFIADKLAAFKKYGPLDIPAENVVLFDKTPQSLLPFLERLPKGNMKFVQDIDRKASELLGELEGDFARQDRQNGTNNSAEFAAMIELLKDSNQASRAQVEAMNKQLLALTG
jgi:GTP-binding protein EngB required for normal cell division